MGGFVWNPSSGLRKGRDKLRSSRVVHGILAGALFLATLGQAGTNPPVAQSAAQADFLPAWVQEDWQFWTQDSGRWLTDNTANKSQNEPFDAYGMEWKWGLGKKTLKGRLFALREGKEIGTIWEFHYLWHPAQKRVMLNQFGSDGTYATGTLTPIGENKVEAIERFYNSDGTTMQIGHRAERLGDHVRMQSYNVTEDGVWKERRFYIWKLAK